MSEIAVNLYAIYLCLDFQSDNFKDVKEASSNWYIDNRLSIHIGDNRTKFILFYFET